MSKPADEVNSDPLLLAAPLVEGYRVLEPAVLYDKVGTGGMGVVYRGRHLSLHCDVAVKVLKPDFAQDENFVARFEREAQLAARLSNDNVVRVFDVRQKNRLHYLVMEFIRGETARERVQRKGPLSEDEALAIVVGACRGMRAAHAVGIVHRDIKPDNLLISVDGLVKVADLGLAKGRASGDSVASLSTGIMGTAQFMPPEQWVSPDVTAAADVWSLGASLWYLLVGRHAIEGSTEFVVGQRIREHDFPNVQQARPDVRPAVAEIVAKCTQRDPALRFADAGQLLRALHPFASPGDNALDDPGAGTGKRRMATPTPPPKSTLAKIRSHIATMTALGDVETEVQRGPRPDPEAVTVVSPVEQEPQRRRWLRMSVGLVLVAGLAAVAMGWSNGWFDGDKRQEKNGTLTQGDPPPSLPPVDRSTEVLQRGLRFLAGGELEAAIAAFDEALALDPGLGDARANLVLALTRRADQLVASDPDTSWERLDRVWKFAPDDEGAKAVRPQLEAALRKRLADGLSLDVPAADAMCPDRAVMVRGGATAPGLARVRVALDARDDAASLPFPRERCETADVSDGRFERTIVAPTDGRFAVRLEGEDRRGLLAEAAPMRIVVVDTEDPVVAIDSPADDAEVGKTVKLEGGAKDPNLDLVTVAGRSVAVSAEGRWSAQLDLEGGTQQVEVVARDRAGRETRSVRKLRIDTTPPKMTWVEPPQTTTTVSPGELRVCVAAADAVEVFVKDGQKNTKAQRDGDTWRATVVVGAGESKLTVTARDTAGNAAELSRTLRAEEPSAVAAWAMPVAGAASVVIDGNSYPRVVVEQQTGMRMVLLDACPNGFDMGSPDTEAERGGDEVRHRVVIRHAFWLGETEVTQAQWARVMPDNTNTSHFRSDNNPVEKVNWDDCQKFVQRLNAKGGSFRLPSEGEWEYACRARGPKPFSFGDTLTTAQANYDGKFPYAGDKGEYRECTVFARSLPANAFGLYEMHGNVREWCQDVYAPYPLAGSEEAVVSTDPLAKRVMRGGYWGSPAKDCRSASRLAVSPTMGLSHCGLRLARSLR
ncbi:MAG TPA: SUMF1/EgtB/PvdO family nonheme iron enzyme [Planctomycetota bacterium]|nr:SUMF1/EgtB/PvdO family nonheme iron enzyme [Planctomycetota bacterium]